MIHKVFSLEKDFHVLIVDDNSPDGTADIVKSLQAEYEGKLHIHEREGKLGLGTAYIAGFRWALDRHYEFIFEMDADFSHNPDNLIDLYKGCTEKGGDVSVGSRYMKGGGVKNWPLSRIMISRGASMYVQFITWMPVKDTTAGFVCYRRKFLETIELDAIRFIGYAFQIEMKFAAWKLGFKIVEVPITFIDREVGKSKMSTKIFREAFYGVIILKLQSFFKSYKKVQPPV